jgi:DNA-binding XRE family transcriptional regulator
MDKRYNAISLREQIALRQRAIDEVLTHPEWGLTESLRHIRTTLRLTAAELAKLSGVSFRTLQDIEQGRSTGTVQTMNKLFSVLGLRLGVVLVASPKDGS